MVKLFKGKGSSRQQGKGGIDHLTGIMTNKKNKNVNSQDSIQSTSKDTAATDTSKTEFSGIFEDPKLNEYQLMTMAAKKASFGQCFFARHRSSGDIVMIMAIENEFMNKFKADLSDPSKLKTLMASVDPSLSGLRNMIEMNSSTALILDVDMSANAAKTKDYEVKIIEDSTTVKTEMDEPFDDFGSWLKYWLCGAPSNLLLCAARPPALAAPPSEYSDENTNSSNINTGTHRGSKHKRSFGANMKESRNANTDARSVGVLSRVVDVDDAPTVVAAVKRISQQRNIRSRKNSNKDFRSIASIDGSKTTLPSVFSMDSIPPEEDWFSMLDQLLTIDMKR